MSAVRSIVSPPSPEIPQAPTRGFSSAAEHTRVQESFLARPERRALAWLAARTPGRVSPDHMTALGLVGCLLVLCGYALANATLHAVWLASAGLALNWLGDSLDGTLARYRRTERPRYGYFIDHTIDTVNMLLVGLGLGLSPLARMDLALLAICGYFMMSILTYVTTHVRGIFQISYGRLGPTEVRLLLIGLNAVVWALGNPAMELAGASLRIFDVVAFAAAAGMVAAFLATVARQAPELAELDRRR
jgi:archaetidylinositol phosphate synthase